MLTFRLINAFDKANLLENRTYKKVMSVLRRAKKTCIDSGAWQVIRMNPSYIEILQELGLIPKPEEPPKRRPGRPKGIQNKSAVEGISASTEIDKHKCGHPKGSKNKPKNNDGPAGTG